MGLVVKTIGSAGGRDYSTIAGWLAGLPANLVTDGNSQEGDCYKDSEFVIGSGLTISGHTTDSIHTINLTTGAGQSFRDNASVQTNRLAYVAANGVGIRFTGTYASAITVTDSHVTLQNLQVRGDGGATSRAVNSSGPTNVVINSCIVEAVSTGLNTVLSITAGVVKNCAIWGTSDVQCFIVSGSVNSYNCTIAKPAGGTRNIIGGSYAGSPTFENCAFMGASVLESHAGSWTPTYTTCATDSAIASPPTGCTAKTYSTAQFKNITNTSQDLRLVTGSTLLDVGTTDSTNAATDIVGTTRPQGSAYDIGAWELAATAKLRRNASLDGLSASGAFFSNPLAA